MPSSLGLAQEIVWADHQPVLGRGLHVFPLPRAAGFRKTALPIRLSNLVSYPGIMGEGDSGLYGRKPASPPIVELDGGTVGHLLCWEQHERDGSWHAWVSWVQSTGHPVRHRHLIACVRAGTLRSIEDPAAYADVPRRVRGNDGRIRPWTPTQ
jgi:hypothetical protein